MPWLRERFPQLADIAEQALQSIDKVVVAVRRRVKAAWTKLRRKLLKVLVRYEERTSGWVRVITSWCIKQLSEDKVIKRTETEDVSYDDLPDDIREAWLRGRGQTEQDVTAARDRELMTVKV